MTFVDDALERMRAEGVAVLSEPIVAGEGPLEGCRVVYVLDPGRVRVELVEPPARHPALERKPGENSFSTATSASPRM
ncbi:VOC family protein [Streptomyces collinus]|uniref:VOC family protein n=1 Tax=Streptomyces collinus TaxID=42684 RepID=UPI0036A7809B